MSNYLAHTPPLFLKTKILAFSDIYKYILGIHMFKLHSTNLINYPVHNYNTRNLGNATTTFQRLSICQRSLSYKGPKLWNSIPVSIKNSPSIHTFKRDYKLHLLSSYNSD